MILKTTLQDTTSRLSWGAGGPPDQLLAQLRTDSLVQRLAAAGAASMTGNHCPFTSFWILFKGRARATHPPTRVGEGSRGTDNNHHFTDTTELLSLSLHFSPPPCSRVVQRQEHCTAMERSQKQQSTNLVSITSVSSLTIRPVVGSPCVWGTWRGIAFGRGGSSGNTSVQNRPI